MSEQTMVVLSPDAMTPDEGREWVMDSWRRGVEAVLETGHRLRQLKAGRLHGGWLPFVASLPFGERTTQALMQISDHPVLGNPQYIADLPGQWGTLAPLASLSEDDARAAVEAGDINPGMTQADAKVVVDKARGIQPDQKNEWYTPTWVFDLLGLTFDIDVCAPLDLAARRVPARRHYTIEDDGLEQPWQGLIWCNPPYSEPAPWIDRWADHDSGLLLTHASVRAKRTLKLWNAADAIVMFSKMYFTRPNGEDEDINLLLQLAARGPVAVAALRNVAQAPPYTGPLWVPA